TKNGERRSVALKFRALSLLVALRKKRNKAGDDDRIFIQTGKWHVRTFDTYWCEVVDNAGIKNFRFHDLRHTAASYAAMAGASLLELAEMLGHKTLAMVKRYAHLSEAHSATVVDKMNRAMLSGVKL
ncbi:MAG: tyrosine-type recombinase/integrase, partial [Rhodospirillaceae bacterium]|nr:tyrosine-type recombinase/integrase [Rhodospirillaceae bacterium]